MKDTSKLLPIGSVVLLNNGTKKVMITGFYSVAANDTSKVFDYCGCLFPEGIISSEQNLLFNHDQIMTVNFMGYKNDEEVEFKTKLGEIVNNPNNAPVTDTPTPEPVAPTPEVPVADTVVPAPETPMTAGVVPETVAPAPVQENITPNNTIEETPSVAAPVEGNVEPNNTIIETTPEPVAPTQEPEIIG